MGALVKKEVSPQVLDQFVRKEFLPKFDRIFPEYFAEQWLKDRKFRLDLRDADEKLVEISGR